MKLSEIIKEIEDEGGVDNFYLHYEKGGFKLKRSERRRIQRQTNPIAIGQKVLENALQATYEAMKDNHIGEDRAEKILHEIIARMSELK